MSPVAVGSDTMKPFTHALALGLYLWVPTEGSSKRFFFAPMTTVLRTKARTHDCGCAEGKQFILTQGGRMREGATPSDKRAIRLIDCCRDRFSGPINKAVALDKGLTPSRTPQRGDV